MNATLHVAIRDPFGSETLEMSSDATDTSLAGIALCGGQSRRMGRPKYSLAFGSETTLQRVVRSISQVTGRIVVVGMEGIDWPEFTLPVTTSIDPSPYPGPLAALVQGFETLPDSVSHVLLTACDFPLISPGFLKKLVEQRNPRDDIIVVQEETFPQPFAAVYQRSILPIAKSLLDKEERSLQALLTQCRTRFVPAEEFRDVDPMLHSLRNMNTMQDYQELLRVAAGADQ